MKQMKTYREKKGMSQTELAKAVGISQSEISSYESGVKSPRVNVALAIAEVLGVKIGELVK